MEHENEDPVGAMMSDVGRLLMRAALWLIPAMILVAAAASIHGDIRQSWALGGPGSRHAGDVAPELRKAWDAP